MSSFIKGLLAGVLLVFVVTGLLGAVVVLAGRSEPDIPSDSALVVRLEGGIPEHIDAELPGFFSGRSDGSGTTLYGLTQAIRRAAEDENVKALVLRCNGSGAGWAKAQEVRWAIQAFKESGKPVWAYLALAGREGYYISSLADRVAIQPESFLNLSGLRAEVMFFKGALDKLGVQADLIRSGKYKSAGEPFTRDEMSPDFREAMNVTLDEFYGQLLDGIAAGRGRDAEHWRAILDEGPYTVAEAETHGLVDDVMYENVFYEQLSEAVDVEDVHRIGVARYAGKADSTRSGGRKKIAMLHAIGTITSGSSWTDPFSGQHETLGAETFESQLERLREDDDVEGVILRIDSPGGDAIASDQMLHAVRRLSEEKPLVVSMSTLAASGGYYIASVPDVPIVAYPGTYTGSIGVFTIHFNLRKLYDKLGISKDILTRGRFAAVDSDYKSMTPAEREKLSRYVTAIYEAFLARVSEGRGVDADSIHELAQGRVWVGNQALANGLVDELGGYDKAIELVKEAAEIGEDEAVQVVHYPPRRTLFETLFSGGRQVALREVLETPLLREAYRTWTQALRWARRLRGGPMYMAPYTLSVD